MARLGQHRRHKSGDCINFLYFACILLISKAESVKLLKNASKQTSCVELTFSKFLTFSVVVTHNY